MACNAVATLTVAVPPYSGDEVTEYAFGGTDTSYQVTAYGNSSSGGSVRFDIDQVNAGGAVVHNDEHQTGTSWAGLTFLYAHAILATATKLRITVHASSSFADWTGVFVTAFCGPARPGVEDVSAQITALAAAQAACCADVASILAAVRKEYTA
jgi:hypothetical protein